MPPEQLAELLYAAVTRSNTALIPGPANRLIATPGRLAPARAEELMRRTLLDKLPRTGTLPGHVLAQPVYHRCSSCIIGVAAHRPKGAVPLKEGWMLRVYVADDCPGSPTARQRADRLRARARDAHRGGRGRRAGGSGTGVRLWHPDTYTWDGRIIFLGNPSDQELLERARSLYE